MSQEKLRQKVRTGHQRGPRTGQQVMGPAPVPAVVRENGNGPACGQAPGTTPISWGSACPPGGCTAESLAAALNRSFAGERYPCRELTYWTKVTATAGGVAAFAGNAIVTICPTRVIVDNERHSRVHC